MAIFERKPKAVKENTETIKESNINTYNYQVGDLDAYNFVRGLRQISTNTYNNDFLYDNMMDDATISSAIDMYIEDTLQVDPQKKEIFWVEVDTPDDNLEDKLSKGLTDELNRFLKEDLRMDKELKSITRRLLQYGTVVGKLDFVDTLEDDRLALLDKNKKTFESISESLSNVKEDLDKDYYAELYDLKREDDIDYSGIIKESAAQLEKVKKSNRTKYKEALKEDSLIDVDNTRRLMRGRWYFQKIGQGTNLWELSAKGKTIAYIDIRRPDRLIKPDNLVSFTNKTGKYSVNLEVGPYDESADKKEFFTIEQGESYLDAARIAWQTLSALEDILMLTRMTRSILYRIFSVEVASLSNKETANILNNLKNRIRNDETINVKEKIYKSDLRQVPLGDSIFIPTRNGIGAIDIKTVGGDVNLKDAIDLDYFKDKLFAALRIPKAFLGFGDESTGGMINTSLTRMDIRYSRTVRGIQSILAEGMKDLCLKYLAMTRPKTAVEELPDFKIVFTSINTDEDNARNESKKTQMETLQKVIEAFGDLGIEVGQTKELRDALIKEWIGSDYLEIVRKAEKEGELVQSDEEGGGPGPSLGGGPSFDEPDLGNFESEIEEPTEEGENTEEGGEEFDEETMSLDADFEAPEEVATPTPAGRELR